MVKKKTSLTVIFDFDGTLANTVDLVVRLYNEKAHEFGALEVHPDEFSALRTMGYKKAMKTKKVRWYMLPKLIVMIRRGLKKNIAEVEPYKGMELMVHDVKKRGVSIGILTSNDGEFVQSFLSRHKFPPFDFLVSEKTIFGKEKALEKIMERHRLQKDRVIYVGDEPRDVTSSHKAGIRVFGVTWGFGGRESMEPVEPDELFDSVKDLKKALLAEL